MQRFCNNCDRSLIFNRFEYQNYLNTANKGNDRSTYIKYTINKISLDELDKIINEYITTHNEKFDFYSINCELVEEFDNNFTENIETDYLYITNIITFNRIITRIYKYSNVCNIKQMILKTINN